MIEWIGRRRRSLISLKSILLVIPTIAAIKDTSPNDPGRKKPWIHRFDCLKSIKTLRLVRNNLQNSPKGRRIKTSYLMAQIELKALKERAGWV